MNLLHTDCLEVLSASIGVNPRLIPFALRAQCGRRRPRSQDERGFTQIAWKSYPRPSALIRGSYRSHRNDQLSILRYNKRQPRHRDHLVPEMIAYLSKRTLLVPLAVLSILLCSHFSQAQVQDNCLTADDVKKMQAQLSSLQSVTLNKKLRDELLQLGKKDYERVQRAISERKTDDLADRLRDARDRNADSLCLILKEYGW